MRIKGAIDDETRCEHFHTENDRVAIKFYCCGGYFPCFRCHQRYGCGDSGVWPKEKFDQKAILCGSCHTELTINEYLGSSYRCPACQAAFNPDCALHYHLYFKR
ncbi:CHY zinc finger protein [Lentibacillus kapialis]|uniref:CHY zinc finger protein n=1 Tax=Lentibacillus kapialis TaxID=340214 RepID=UPI00166ED84B|nr:CHY zinc finger protein [Lentibacillus kapialis]